MGGGVSPKFAMTQAVIDNKNVLEFPNDTIKLCTALEKYMEEHQLCR
jgi:hypothetical protein